MVTTKTSNMSQDSNKKNQHTSPSKVKLDIHNEVRENEEEDGDKKKQSPKKKVNKKKT
jgi:hypothetical protein